MFRSKLVLCCLLAACLLFARTASAQASKAFQPGDLVVSMGNFMDGSSAPGNPNEILEFTRAGALVQSFPIQGPVGGQNVPKADFVGPNGILYVLNGEYLQLSLSICNPVTNAWTFYTCPNWTGGGFQVYG